MITEFEIIDHMHLDEEKNRVLMLIVDYHDLWEVQSGGGLFNYKAKKLANEKRMLHLVCLKKKVENYISCIMNDGVQQFFPECDDLEKYSYEIHVVTDFEPDAEYMDLIQKMNRYIATQRYAVNVKKITSIINEWDPVCLFPIAPKDEYENEINKLCEYINATEEINARELAEFVMEIFTATFGRDVFKKDMAECMGITEKILEQQGINVVVKHLFT